MSEYVAGLEGVIAAETALSYLDVAHEEIVIRGYDLIDLAEKMTYLDVGFLLLSGHLPTEGERADLAATLKANEHLPPALWDLLGTLPKAGHLMDWQRTAVSALATFDPDPGNFEPRAAQEKIYRLWAQLPLITAGSYHLRRGQAPYEPTPDLSYSAGFLQLITGRRPEPAEATAFDRLLTLYSEHEMPNSTFAARVIASTLADLYGALTGAISSLKGTLHGGANEAVMHMLLEAQDEQGIERLIREKLQRKERIMGFGHRVYMNKMDPRAAMVKRLLARLCEATGDRRLLNMCEIGERVMREEKGLYPNLDYYAAPAFYTLGIPIELYTPLFFAARFIGIAAHVLEQHQNNRLFRPRVRYTGPRCLRAPGEGGLL